MNTLENRRVSLWLVPGEGGGESPADETLATVFTLMIHGLAEAHGGPTFPVHLTLLTLEMPPTRASWKRLRLAAAKLAAGMTPQRVSFGQIFGNGAWNQVC